MTIVSIVGLSALIAIAAIAVEVLLGIWTYRDAENKGMVGILWTAIVILVPSCIGLIIYLIVRMDNNKVTCSNCSQRVNGKTKYCSNCGMELVPIVDISEDDKKFKKSQRNILIGLFSTLGGIVAAIILLIASLIGGAIGFAVDASKWAAEFATNSYMVENVLGDLDVLLDSDIANISVNGDEITIQNEEGDDLIHIDGSDGEVEINVKDIKALLEKYDIEYNENDLDEEKIEQKVHDAIQDMDDDF